MSVFRIGNTKSDSQLAIVIYVEFGTVCDWRLLQAAVQESCRSSSNFLQNEHLQVEFFPGKLSTSVGKALNYDESLTNYPDSLRMGVSIGSNESPWTGTLGGFVNLRVGNRLHHGLLTNHHTIRPHPKKSKDIQPENSFKYLQPNDTTVQMPSSEDLSASREAISKDIVKTRKALDELQKQKDDHLTAGARVAPGLEQAIQNHVSLLDVEHRIQSDYEIYPVTLGHPLVSSGNLVNSKSNIVD